MDAKTNAPFSPTPQCPTSEGLGRQFSPRSYDLPKKEETELGIYLRPEKRHHSQRWRVMTTRVRCDGWRFALQILGQLEICVAPNLGPLMKGRKMDSRQKGNRRKGRTGEGKPCRAAATSGGLCFFHANPNKAAELGRIGGRKNRRLAADVPDPLPKLNKVSGVRDAVEKLIADVYAGRLQPRVAAGLAPLMNLLLRTIETSDLEERVAIIEKQFAAVDSAAARKSGLLAPSSH
jgi:hypothetical protein